MSRAIRIVMLYLVLAITAACGAGGSTEPRVTSFDVGDAMCTADGGTVKVTWETENATGVELVVSGDHQGTLGSFGPSGEALLPIPCSGGQSTITITPSNDEGTGPRLEKSVGG